VHSHHTETFGGLLEIKEEDEDDNLVDSSWQEEVDVDRVLHQINVDPALRFVPHISSGDNGRSANKAHVGPYWRKFHTRAGYQFRRPDSKVEASRICNKYGEKFSHSQETTHASAADQSDN